MISPFYPCLWFNSNALEAANFYLSFFPDSKIIAKNDIVVQISLNGQRMMLLNGRMGKEYTESVSLVLECDTQEEIDNLWDNLKTGGQELGCGWVVDQFGMRWQIIPRVLSKLMSIPEKMQKTVEIFQSMTKFEIAPLAKLLEEKIF